MTNTTKKATKRTHFEALDAIINAVGSNIDLSAYEGVTVDSIHDFIARELELLDNKAAAAQKRAFEKKKAGDELRDQILGILTTEAQSVDAIVATVQATINKDASKNVVVSRLTQLCSAEVGLAVKEEVKVITDSGKTKTVSGYRLS